MRPRYRFTVLNEIESAFYENLRNSQDVVLDAAERGELEFTPPMHGFGPSYITWQGRRVPINSAQIIDIAAAIHADR